MMGSITLDADLSSWPGIVLRLSDRGEIVASNGALERVSGLPAEGSSIESFIDAESSLGKWKRAVGDQRPDAVELILAADGQLTDPRAFSILRQDNGDVILVEHPSHPRLQQMAAEVASTNTDLTMAQRALVVERARLAAALKELERSNTALDEFAHAVSHDLKAPLRGILDAKEVLEEKASTADEKAKYLERIDILVQRMRKMIDGAFEYARAGRSGGTAERFASRDVMAGIIDYLSPPASIEVALSDTLPTLTAERVPFEQVFRNLLSNAFTYRRADAARIEVRATENPTAWEFIVADNGPGISVAQQAIIWRLFHTSRPGEGTGIGLAVVRRLVEAQGGSITVESAEGQGTAFHVHWPKRPPSDGRLARG